ncbi:MAG TPA: hypothetical protein VNL98_01975 [Gemmatimonadales bacterium]|nr:hypothetical protein [Gemmatimonadales bacterium]
MLRTILGFAILAIVAIVVLNLALGLLGFAFKAAWFLLKLALIGLVVYWVLKLIAPSTARRVEEIIKGNKAAL